ncbi:arylmalonate decarboxylase [Kitasatospora sp. LaBMicrA B282]|uniref:aspartate racemase/maleate isomerase family protein n=1 Tax=Kitasatospora sp. LaBMicrA B282 TaxID=3420949 RepID=UPI003D11A4A0
MPHLEIKHFPKDFTEPQQRRLAADLTALIVDHFATYPGAVSIALHPVEPQDWPDLVVQAEIAGHAHRLIKSPEYRTTREEAPVMPDNLGPRLKVGVVVPSTNTSAQPELEALRPHQVTNHTGRMVIGDDAMVDEPGFDHVMHSIRSSTHPAIRSVVSCNPDCVIVGVSPESYWEGPDSHARVLASMREAAGGLPVIMSPDAINAALGAYGARRIGVITPYLPVGDDSVSRFFKDSGYQVVGIQGLGMPSPAQISHVTDAQLREAVLAVDGPEVEAIVQVGTNVPMMQLAAAAEAWLGKPVLSNNVVLYWHALRQAGIRDRIHGHGSLLAEH